MSHNLIPVTGRWYRHLDKGQPFCVVDVEKGEDRIEIQHFDGDIEELGFADWFEMALGIAAEPEDASGPLDDVETAETGFGETAMTPDDWRASLEAGEHELEGLEDADLGEDLEIRAP